MFEKFEPIIELRSILELEPLLDVPKIGEDVLSVHRHKRTLPFKYLPQNWFRTKSGFGYAVDELNYLLPIGSPYYQVCMLKLRASYGAMTSTEYQIEMHRLSPDFWCASARIEYLQTGNKAKYINFIIHHMRSKAQDYFSVEQIPDFVALIEEFYVGTKDEIAELVLGIQLEFKLIDQDDHDKTLANARGKPWWNLSLSYNQEDGSTTAVLDYNTFFVEVLRKNGYTGTDDAVVDEYIAAYYKTSLREDFGYEE